MSAIERWTLHAHHAFDYELEIKEGPLPEWGSDTRMVREEDYDTLADAYREAVAALERIADLDDEYGEETAAGAIALDALVDLGIRVAGKSSSGPGEATG